jgi:hypothetical protein
MVHAGNRNTTPASDEEALPEIRLEAYNKLDHWRDKLDQTAKLKKRDIFERAAADLFLEAEYERDLAAVQAIVDAIYVLGRDYTGLNDDDIQYIMDGAKIKAERPINDHAALGGARGADEEPPPPLTIEEWLVRDLPPPDFVMGSWLSTTTRELLVGPTGLGKTNLALALALHGCITLATMRTGLTVTRRRNGSLTPSCTWRRSRARMPT